MQSTGANCARFQIFHKTSDKLEQLECLCCEDTPATPWLPILVIYIGSHVKTRQGQRYKFKEFAKISIFLILKKMSTRHTCCCLIRFVNIKWIRWVLLKIQSGHDSVHRRADGQGETSVPFFQFRWLGSGGYKKQALGYTAAWQCLLLQSKVLSLLYVCFLLLRRSIYPRSIALQQEHTLQSNSSNERWIFTYAASNLQGILLVH